MDNKSTTKRMIGAVVLVLIAALLLAWLLKGKNKSVQQQELIADQTNQGSTPILGFPGVKEGEEGATKEGDAPYVIGGQQQGEQTAPAADQQQAADAGATGEAATDKGVVAAAAGGAVAGAATAGKEAVQTLANNFQVRDSDEQRQVVDDGQAKAGTGSMGSSELALPKQGETDGATQQAQTTETAPAAQQQAQKTQQTASTGSAAQEQQPEPKKQAIPNVKLVGEKAVPKPRSQSSAASSADQDEETASASTGSASQSAAQQTATGAKGYAIQVLAASSRNKAEQVRKSIAVDGYPVFVVKARVNNKTVYRVRVGTYPARNAARSVQSKMKARYTKNQYVQNSFVTKN
uniref:SPOR domain-containing protein n=1 Tax=uncultured Thiotrichaceae bacterium TaxID=298394 RepID=A0A6S6TP59_9GAMM|nr:MAG: Unknown protein [uncultured Thiotrichaceae bacterium]